MHINSNKVLLLIIIESKFSALKTLQKTKIIAKLSEN